MAVEDNDPRPVLRKELARVFKNQRVVRAFEKIFDLIPTEFINQQTQIDEIIIELSQLPSNVDVREQTKVLIQGLQDVQQGPII
jgi:hypothetical protein